MVQIQGKNYELVELSARRYQAVLDALESQLGEDWQKRRSVEIGVILLSNCMKPQDDGSAPTADEIWEWPVRKVIDLTNEAMVLNGFTTQAAVEKN